MNWKRFADWVRDKKPNESHFILGMDLGDDSSALAFYNIVSDTAELIDISGGYGRPSVPTVIQYVNESKEWVFGEYAVLNESGGKDATLRSLTGRLGQREYLELDGKTFSFVQIVGMYLKEIIGSIKNINPKAEVVGIAAAVDGYASENFLEELRRAFKMAGYDKELIRLASDRECLLTYYLSHEKPASERILILDYGSRALRGSVVSLYPGENAAKLAVTAGVESYLFDEQLGSKRIDEKLADMLVSDSSLQPSRQMRDHMPSFLFQHRDLLLQKTDWQKPLRLYFNFLYPPTQSTIDKAQMDNLLAPFQYQFDTFIDSLAPQKQKIQTVLCAGGGFEMQWVREAVRKLFPSGKIVFYKNAKGAFAQGAALVAAQRLRLTRFADIRIDDRILIQEEIGIQARQDAKEKFIPIINAHSFWWQSFSKLYIIVNETKSIPLLRRLADGNLVLLNDIRLDDLPRRPRGALKLSLSLSFENRHALVATVQDCGFGELFTKTDYLRKVKINYP